MYPNSISQEDVLIDKSRLAAKGFGERRHTAISSGTIRKAIKGIVGRSEASPLRPEADARLAPNPSRNGMLF